ncbi:hypothetical protein B481_0623 [Planococcus halocryophilus Or1]|nr:hypothetical protein B481_0623 [Planococcus halocryophilus Or1]
MKQVKAASRSYSVWRLFKLTRLLFQIIHAKQSFGSLPYMVE